MISTAYTNLCTFVALAALLSSCTEAPAPQALLAPTILAPTLTVTSVPTSLPVGAMRQDKHGIKQVWVPAGQFEMGSVQEPAEDQPRWADFESEQPAHLVNLTVGYWIDAYEVTNAAFQAFVDAGGYQEQLLWSEPGWKWLQQQDTTRLPKQCVRGEKPMPQDVRVCMTWYEAEAYATWRGGRLPTEAEWEYAARGPQANTFPWGNTFDSAKLNLVDAKGPATVGLYPEGQSWVGAYDMAGNAMEWVQDWYARDYYQQTTRNNPQGPTTGQTKVKKGGWWGGPPYVARAAYRHEVDPPTYQDHHIGFRVVSLE